VYMREGTTWRVRAADRPYGEFYDFYSVIPEYFEYTLVRLYSVCRRWMELFTKLRRDDTGGEI
jgi:hypothetical protein